MDFSADFCAEFSADFATDCSADLSEFRDERHGKFYDGLYDGFDGANVGEIRFPSDVSSHFHDGFYVQINFARPTVKQSIGVLI